MLGSENAFGYCNQIHAAVKNADMDEIVSDAELTITSLVGRIKSKQSAYVPSKREKAKLSEAPGIIRVGSQLNEAVDREA